MALSAGGVGVFAHPHPLHNRFSISALVGYQAPLAFALAWRREPQARVLLVLSGFLYLVIVAAMPLKLTALDRQAAAWSLVEPAYGLAQRTLFAAWFGWCALAGIVLSARQWPRPRRAGLAKRT